jgi:hypothetical protein
MADDGDLTVDAVLAREYRMVLKELHGLERGSKARTVKTTSPPLCEPRFATPRTPARETLGPAIAAAAELLGRPLMPVAAAGRRCRR